MTKSNLSIRGIYRDFVEDAEGSVVYDSGWLSNTIVTSCRVLLASFVMNEPAAGIRFLAVGQGSADWEKNPAPPNPADTGLVDPEPFKVENPEIVYLDENDGVQANPSSRIQVTAKLERGEPPPPSETLKTYPLREFGLFGWLGDETTGKANMINSIRHPVIHKDASASLIRVVRLYF